MLLTLRVDRRLSFQDLARVLHDAPDKVAAENIAREAARLRKRFQAIKDKLLALGIREGIVDKDRSRAR